MLNLPPNWKTTGAGIGAIIIAAGSLISHVSAGDLSTIATDGAIILSGVIGLVAKDSNVTGGTVKQ